MLTLKITGFFFFKAAGQANWPETEKPLAIFLLFSLLLQHKGGHENNVSLRCQTRCSLFLSLPDVDAAQHSEHHTEEKSHGHGQQRAQQAVKDELEQLEGGVASYPHSVEAVRGRGLRDHIFKTNLSGRVSHARTKKDLISADTHGGRSRQRLPGIQISKCYTGTKKGSR